ncbi:hypothetical protein C7G43_30225 [Bradyrhizobium sp. MOS004]|jgi:hypothetical protein|nr:hypothetical protein C7G43_30225 [Bradyrhizobium sp. MOS004]HAQ78907.1 hypothetical protein [Bradyrhizobium sp.]HAR18975.1 hypothetical protein [Bradyrhizobium sp.]HAR27224.1 hypothetical protein [Bradyrhizobium sp.]HBY30177.1 hypothetical protein [Bradyrhizobium sp.]
MHREVVVGQGALRDGAGGPQRDIRPYEVGGGARQPDAVVLRSGRAAAIPAAIVCSAEIDDGIALPIAYRMA